MISSARLTQQVPLSMAANQTPPRSGKGRVTRSEKLGLQVRVVGNIDLATRDKSPEFDDC